VRRERAVPGQLQQPLGERNGVTHPLFNHTQEPIGSSSLTHMRMRVGMDDAQGEARDTRRSIA